ncbi:hypothetical protein K438DRAFT_1857460 [Mycena galopus ATCC 62051]|nr:hypothetical protein K438DRAFT_1857460 [Mycena galopus ATCC 62051]
MTLNPPTPASLDAIRDGLVAGRAIVSQVAALRNQSSSNSEIEAMRTDVLTALVGAGNKFRDGLKLGEKYALAGAEVANSAVYTLEEFAAGKVEDKDIQDIARSLEEPVTELLDNANKMKEHWGSLLTELEKVQYKTEEFQKRVQQAVEAAEEAIRRARAARDGSIFATLGLGILSIFVPPLAGFTVATAVSAVMVDQTVGDELELLAPWKVFGQDLETIHGVVKQAQEATTNQIQLWSDIRVQIELLKKSNARMIKNDSNGWMNKKLLKDWTGAENKFKELVHKTSDGQRFLEAHPVQLSQ